MHTATQNANVKPPPPISSELLEEAADTSVRDAAASLMRKPGMFLGVVAFVVVAMVVERRR